MTHYIRQQYLNIDLKGSESDGLALQSHLSDVFYSKVLPAFDEVMDQCAPPGKILVINRIDIDAGTIELDRIDQDLPKILARALMKSLEKEVAKANLPGTAIETSYFQSYHENRWEIFVFFLRKGYLPWSCKLPEGENLEEVISDQMISEETKTISPIPVLQIKATLKSVAASKRLTLQFSEQFCITLLQKISPELFTLFNGLDHQVSTIKDITISSGELTGIKRLILEKIFFYSAADQIISKSEFVNQMLIELASKPDLQIAGLKVLGLIPDNILNQSNPDDMNNIQIAEKKVFHGLFQESTLQAKEDSKQEDAEGIFIDNAGLVVLHPFLSWFFESLGISKDDKILKPDKALGLLHFLATGETESPEYELVLPKILCGIPLSTPVLKNNVITEIEITETRTLLEAVIKHWEALRNTTPDGLRGNFLVRPGKLSLQDDGDWLLQVESRPYDILLDQLPWGISIIKLPWTKTMLRVEWR